MFGDESKAFQEGVKDGKKEGLFTKLVIGAIVGLWLASKFRD